MRAYFAFLLSRFQWSKSGVWGHIGNVALIAGFLIAILTWCLPDWTRQHISERMNAFALGIIPLTAGASVFFARWFLLSGFFVHKNQANRIGELQSRIVQLERTGLKGRIVNTAMFRDHKERVGIAVTLQITNTGEPSIADNWGLILTLDGVERGFPASHSSFVILTTKEKPPELAHRTCCTKKSQQLQ
jgi:hypothetical protein